MAAHPDPLLAICGIPTDIWREHIARRVAFPTRRLLPLVCRALHRDLSRHVHWAFGDKVKIEIESASICIMHETAPPGVFCATYPAATETLARAFLARYTRARDRHLVTLETYLTCTCRPAFIGQYATTAAILEQTTRLVVFYSGEVTRYNILYGSNESLDGALPYPFPPAAFSRMIHVNHVFDSALLSKPDNAIRAQFLYDAFAAGAANESIVYVGEPAHALPRPRTLARVVNSDAKHADVGIPDFSVLRDSPIRMHYRETVGRRGNHTSEVSTDPLLADFLFLPGTTLYTTPDGRQRCHILRIYIRDATMFMSPTALPFIENYLKGVDPCYLEIQHPRVVRRLVITSPKLGTLYWISRRLLWTLIPSVSTDSRDFVHALMCAIFLGTEPHITSETMQTIECELGRLVYNRDRVWHFL